MVKKAILPKVLGIVRDYAPKLAKPKGKGSEKVLDLTESVAKPVKEADSPVLF